jgi:IS5 family transposase
VIPAFGYKNHINVDRRHRLIRRWTVTDAAVHDGTCLPEILDKNAFHNRVWADTAYRSAANERAIEKAGRHSMIHFRKPKGQPMSGPHRRANRTRAKVRSAVEHVFAEQKARMRLFVRTVGLARARVKIGMATCCGSHLSALRLALIGRFGLRLGETIQATRLTLGDPGLTLRETGLRSSALAHA